MSRDHRELFVFALADRLVNDVYAVSRTFPSSERFGLQAQIRKAAISAACNIVEGCARRTSREYVSFLNIAAGSAAEARYLVGLAVRLGLTDADEGIKVEQSYRELSARLQALIKAVSPEP